MDARFTAENHFTDEIPGGIFHFDPIGFNLPGVRLSLLTAIEASQIYLPFYDK